MPNLQRIVLVDDEKTTAKIVENALSRFDLTIFNDPKKALSYCLSKPFDLLIADQKMPGMAGLELIREIKKQKDDFFALVLSAYTEAEIMLDAVNSKLLYQYLVKPIEVNRLEKIVEEALGDLARWRHELQEREEQANENQILRQENSLLKFYKTNPLDAIYGTHPSMLKIKEQLKTYSLSDHPVLISGEEGSGKKLCAQVLHKLSNRRDLPFVHFDVSNFNEETVEVELFGSTKGGNKVDREGFLAQADRGILYISGFTLLDKAIQAKLLRYLNYGTYYNVGGEQEKTADVRLIFSCVQDPLREVQAGNIRKDLFYKIGTLHIKLSPLRDRRSDIVGLIDFIVKRRNINFPPLTTEAIEFFTRYLYPGNVRELEGLIEKVYVQTRSRKNEAIDLEDLGKILDENVEMYRKIQGETAVIRTIQLPTGAHAYSMKEFIRGIEKELIENALEQHNLNISQTARILMVSRQGLKNKIKRYGLEGYDDEDEGEEVDSGADDEDED